MNSIRAKIVWLSMMIVGVGYPILESKLGMAQERGGRSVRATPDRTQNDARHMEQNRSQNRSDSRNNSRQFDNNGRWNDRRQWSNGFANRDRDDKDRDRGRDRERHGHDRNNYGSGFFWGSPYGYSYDEGYYGAPDYNFGPTYGFNSGNPYDMGYSDGFSAGQFDRNQGNLYNPRQYERSGNAEYFEGFVAGYEDGFRR